MTARLRIIVALSLWPLFAFAAEPAPVPPAAPPPPPEINASAYILIDSSWPTLLPQYPQHLREKTGTDRLASVFQYLRDKSDSVILVSTPERNAMIQKYLAAVYHDRYVFDPLRPNVPLNQDGAALYVIK